MYIAVLGLPGLYFDLEGEALKVSLAGVREGNPEAKGLLGWEVLVWAVRQYAKLVKEGKAESFRFIELAH